MTDMRCKSDSMPIASIRPVQVEMRAALEGQLASSLGTVARGALLAALCTVFTIGGRPLAAQQNPSTMPKVGSVSPRFQSYNVEMVEVIGGRFWKPYRDTSAAAVPSGPSALLDPSHFEQRAPINLTDPRLRMLAAALGPAYVRVSGSWANTVVFQNSDAPAPAPAPAGFNGVLTRAQWKGVVDFSHAVDAPIVTSFAVSQGTRDAAGVWNPTQAAAFLAYNRFIGGSIAGAEFMNEPTYLSAAGVSPSYDGAAYGRDFAVFRAFFRQAEPRALLLGPGSVGEGMNFPVKLLPSKDLLARIGPDAVDVFSYHFYGGVSERCTASLGAASGTTEEAALTSDWLSRTDTVEAFYAHLRDQYEPGKPMWLTETGQTACGGDRWASTFLDTFRYIDQLGDLARRKVQVVIHNTLAGSDYALIDGETLTPRPNYWAALLWHQTMGTTVLDPGPAPDPSVHLYAQCLKDSAGGVALLALNLDTVRSAPIHIPAGSVRLSLTAAELTSRSVQLNGRELTLTSSGALPVIRGTRVRSGMVSLAPASVNFFTIPRANNPACR